MATNTLDQLVWSGNQMIELEDIGWRDIVQALPGLFVVLDPELKIAEISNEGVQNFV